jgi:hypothetical protein
MKDMIATVETTIVETTVVTMMMASLAALGWEPRLRGRRALLLRGALHTWRISTFRSHRLRVLLGRLGCQGRRSSRDFLINFWAVRQGRFHRVVHRQWALARAIQELRCRDCLLRAECPIMGFRAITTTRPRGVRALLRHNSNGAERPMQHRSNGAERPMRRHHREERLSNNGEGRLHSNGEGRQTRCHHREERLSNNGEARPMRHRSNGAERPTRRHHREERLSNNGEARLHSNGEGRQARHLRREERLSNNGEVLQRHRPRNGELRQTRLRLHQRWLPRSRVHRSTFRSNRPRRLRRNGMPRQTRFRRL